MSNTDVLDRKAVQAELDEVMESYRIVEQRFFSMSKPQEFEIQESDASYQQRLEMAAEISEHMTFLKSRANLLELELESL